MIDVALNFDQVSRIYPRDISDIPSAILREMFLPRSLLKTPTPDSFFALRDINFSLCKGQKLGVIGAHRSGKTILAELASGILQPTGGRVTAQGARLLISRPTAGFKMTLTSIENLRLRASLAGLHGELLDTVLDKTLSCCEVGDLEARTPMGNLSPYIVKQLGLTLLIEIPTDILIVDEISNAGIGVARSLTRELLKKKIDASTALVISSDPNFMQEVVEDALVLHHGRLYGPFSTKKAIEFHNQLSQDVTLFSDFGNESSIVEGHNSDDQANGGDTKIHLKKTASLQPQPSWKILSINVDGSEFKRNHYSLIRRPGESIDVEVELISLCKQIYSGGEFILHGGNSRLEIGRHLIETADMSIEAQQKYHLRFSLTIPDYQEDSYGLTFSPRGQKINSALDSRMKILIFGVAKKHLSLINRELDIHNQSLKRKINDASINT
jgi:ABC-type polysaccharide/polyol phosphate transport system ATPase subunit